MDTKSDQWIARPTAKESELEPAPDSWPFNLELRDLQLEHTSIRTSPPSQRPSAISSGPLMIQQTPTDAISSKAIESFKYLSEVILSGSREAIQKEISPVLWRDELGRFRVWIANIGAHQKGQSSLDYRLRDSSHIRTQIIRLLDRLRRVSDDLKRACYPQPQSESLSEQEEISSDEDGDDSEDESTEMKQIYHYLCDTINELFKVSMLIRRPAKYDRILGVRRSDAIAYEPFDRQHVRNKFPNVDDEIADRLGLAISHRRALLRYRERHSVKLSQGLNDSLNDQSDTKSDSLSETQATEFLDNFGFSEEMRSDTSQTSYAMTIINSNDGPCIPPLPQESADEAPFECPYCFTIITVSGFISWHRHVLHDLLPYVCIFPGCSTPRSLYESRRDWFFHLGREHLIAKESSQTCILCKEIVPYARLSKHIGRHLEELALFALPRSGMDENVDAAELSQLGKEHDDESLSGSQDQYLQAASNKHGTNHNDDAHTSKRPGKTCPWRGCNAGPFSGKANLGRHIQLIHTESRRYKCPVNTCGMIFNRQDNLISHMRALHGWK